MPQVDLLGPLGFLNTNISSDKLSLNIKKNQVTGDDTSQNSELGSQCIYGYILYEVDTTYEN